jgi:hypothetical protein
MSKTWFDDIVNHVRYSLTALEAQPLTAPAPLEIAWRKLVGVATVSFSNIETKHK